MARSPVYDMPLAEVLALMRLFDEAQLEVVIDGGWAVDALLGNQTRSHLDLDIAMPHKHVPVLRRLLQARGYIDVPQSDTRECNFVMGDNLGHVLDVHTYTFDEQDNLVFGLPYPPDSLAGHGVVDGYPVRCITPEWLVKFHTGYPLDENDFHDVLALCRMFVIELPGEYTHFILAD